MTNPFENTYGKVILSLFIASAFMLSLFGYLYYSASNEEIQVYETSNAQFIKEIKLLLDLKTDPYRNITDDLTFWDGHYNYAKRKDHSEKRDIWYLDNIGSMVTTYNIDYVATYDNDQNLIGNKFLDDSRFETLNCQDFFSDVIKEKLTHFYYESNIGLLEIHAGSIHPSNDSSRKLTTPSGIFILANQIDIEYFKKIINISGATLQIMDNKNAVSFNKEELTCIIPLKNSEGKAFKNLVFKRNFKLNYKNSKEIIKIIMIFYVLILVIVSFFLEKYIYQPLYLTTKVLEDSRPSDIKKLQKLSGEFGYIGNLFFDHNKQKLQLIAAKEKAEESNKLKSSFLTNLSHEIRTPMNAIVGFTDLLEDKNLTNDEKLKYIDIIKESGQNLVKIIDDLIKMSKINTKQIKPNYSSFCLNEFLKHIKETIDITLPDDFKVKFILKIPSIDSLKSRLISDEVKLRQIIINLINNAIKFTKKGSITFGYTINYDAEFIEFFIKDTGIGIEEKDFEQIFSRFHKIQTNENMNLIGL